MKNDIPWWHTLYDDNLAAMLLDNNDVNEIENTLKFLIKYLSLTPNKRVFDQCCGTGRLALALARNHEVIGIDLIRDYIESAKSKVENNKLNAEFIVADAFEYTLFEPVDIAINWWTSFGYSDDDQQNTLMIKHAFNSIKDNGFYALDFMNVPGIYRHFSKDVVTSVVNNGEELTLVRKSTIDFSKDRLVKEWRYFTKDGETATHYSDVSLYTPGQLIEMFEKTGFVDVHLYGDLDGNALTLDSPRCIVVGKKP